MNFIKNKLKLLKELPSLIEGNSFSVNLLLLLGLTAFILISADLGSQLSAEKDEIGAVIAVLEESFSSIDLSAVIIQDIERPLLYEIPLLNSNIENDLFLTSNDNRGPPAA